MWALFIVHCLGLKGVGMPVCVSACTRVKARKSEADQILLDMDYSEPVQIEGCFYIVPNEWSQECEALVMLTAEL